MKKFHSNRSIIVEVNCLGEMFSPMGARGLTIGEKIVSGFSFLTIPFHMKQVSLKSDHYCGSSLFGGKRFSPMGERGLKLASPTILRGHN